MPSATPIHAGAVACIAVAAAFELEILGCFENNIRLNFGCFLVGGFFKYELLLQKYEHQTYWGSHFTTLCIDVMHVTMPYLERGFLVAFRRLAR